MQVVGTHKICLPGVTHFSLCLSHSPTLFLLILCYLKTLPERCWLLRHALLHRPTLLPENGHNLWKCSACQFLSQTDTSQSPEWLLFWRAQPSRARKSDKFMAAMKQPNFAWNVFQQSKGFTVAHKGAEVQRQLNPILVAVARRILIISGSYKIRGVNWA